jgi:hypothetical protein
MCSAHHRDAFREAVAEWVMESEEALIIQGLEIEKGTNDEIRQEIREMVKSAHVLDVWLDGKLEEE